MTKQFIAARIAEFKSKGEVVDFIWDRLCEEESVSCAVLEAMEEFELVMVDGLLRPIHPTANDGRIAG